jgi:hypothetical protein
MPCKLLCLASNFGQVKVCCCEIKWLFLVLSIFFQTFALSFSVLDEGKIEVNVRNLLLVPIATFLSPEKETSHFLHT